MKYQRIISLLLIMAMLAGMVPPVSVSANETEVPESAQTEAAAPEMEVAEEETALPEVTIPAEEESMGPAEPETEPAVETTEPEVPMEGTEAPTEAVTEPSEAPLPEEPAEETVAPTEAVTEPSEETVAPEEETVPEETMEETVSNEAMGWNTHATGTCGSNLTWHLDTAGTLTISGTGAMTDYAYVWMDYGSYNSDSPFTSYKLYIESVVVEEGVASIGAYAFYECDSITNVSLPSTLTDINQYAFSDCEALRSIDIPNGVTQIGDKAFWYCTSLYSAFIPEGVTSIGSHAFYNCESLSYIAVPRSVTSVGKYAFASSGVTSVFLLGGLTSISDGLFSCCTELTSIKLHEGITSIGQEAFYLTDLESIVLPEGVTSIGKDAFRSCMYLKHVTIPVSVTSIADGAFYGSGSIASVSYAGTKTQWDKIQIGLNNTDLTDAIIMYNSSLDGTDYKALGSHGDGVIWALDMSNVLHIIGEGPMEYQSGSPWYDYREMITEVIIEDGVTAISERAFYGLENMTKAYIPASVTTIETQYSSDSPFYGCSTDLTIYCEASSKPSGWGKYWNYLKYNYFEVYADVCYGSTWEYYDYWLNVDSTEAVIVIPHGITNIPKRAFASFRNLTTVIIPDSVTSIESSAFENCQKLTSVVIPESVTSIEGFTFSGCSSLTTVTIPENVTEIGSYAFSGCSSLTEITIPDKVRAIGEGAFKECESLETVVIPDGVASIEPYTFDKCYSLKNITIPGSVKIINGGAFVACSMNSIVIPEGVTQINTNAFAFCDRLTEVTIPRSVKTIQAEAFYTCRGLTTVNITQSTSIIASTAFYGCSALHPVNYHITDLRSWCTTDGPTMELTNVTFLYNGEPIEELIIPDGVETIGSNAFAYFSTVTSVIIPDSVTTIEDGAFKRCVRMTSVQIPDSVTVIEDEAFWYCRSLTSIQIPDSVTVIGNKAFQYCEGLTSIQVPGGDISMGTDVFSKCTSLTEITFDEDVTAVPDRMFQGCSSLETLVIPEYITSVGENAFSDCVNLKAVYIPASVTDMAGDDLYNGPFYGCTYAPRIYCEAEKEPAGWGEYWDGFTVENNYYLVLGSYFGYSLLDYAFWSTLDTQAETIVVPEGVSKMPDGAFYECKDMVSVTLPESLTYISIGAFQGCYNLESVTLPNTLTRICSSAFEGCTAMTELVLPDSLVEIGDFAFSSSDLVEIVIPEGVSVIRNDTFSFCRDLQRVTIPRGVEVIDDNAFWGCVSLKLITFRHGTNDELWISSNAFAVSSNETTRLIKTCIRVPVASEPNPVIADRDWTIWNRDVSWQSHCDHYEMQEGVTDATCTQNGFTGIVSCETCGKILAENAVIPPLGHDSDENSICRRCGELVVLASGTCGESTDYRLMGNYTLVISGSGAMEDYSRYHKAPWSEQCETILSVIIEEGVTSVGSNAFDGCAAMSAVSIAQTVQSIGDEAFWGCGSLGDVSIPANVTFIGEYVFQGCTALTNILVDGNNTAYCNDERGVLFNLEKTELIHAPGALTGSYQIPDTVTSVSAGAFANCDGLSELTIPAGVAAIGSGAFADTDIRFGGTIEQWLLMTKGEYAALCSDGPMENGGICGTDVIWVFHENGTLVISGTGEMSDFDSSGYWMAPWNKVGPERIHSVIIRDGITRIGNRAFWGCGNLKQVEIPQGVESLGISAFANCVSLESISLPETLRDISFAAFENCSSLKHIDMPGVTVIGIQTFYQCDSLTDLVLPAGITNVQRRAFLGCDLLDTIYFQGDIPDFGDNAFEGVTLTVYYPAANKTWKKNLLKDYEGIVLWHPYTMEAEILDADGSRMDGTTLWVDLNAGLQELNFSAQITPEIGDGTYVWSYDSDLADCTVHEDGTITVIPTGKTGTMKLTATAQDGSGAAGTVTIRFVSLQAGREEITGEDPADVNLLSGRTKTLKVYDSDTGKALTSKQITWFMDEIYAPYARIDKTGKLTARKVVEKVRVEAIGTIVGSESTTVVMTVDIFPAVSTVELMKGEEKVNGKTITVDRSTASLVLNADIYPLDAMSGVTWTISDRKETYASYQIADNVLTVTPKAEAKAGTVTIKVTSNDGSKKTATVKLQFAAYAKTVTIDKSVTELTAGDKAVQLSAAMDPAEVTKPGIVWRLKNAADKAYVSLTSAGKITPKNVLAPVEVTVVAVSKDGMAMDEHTIKIWPKAANQLVIKAGDAYVTKTTQVLDVNTQESITLAAHIYGEDAVADVEWKPLTSKAAEITQNEDGTLTIKMTKAGTINVTARTKEGKKVTATVTIKGVKQAQSVQISQKRTNITEGLEVASGKSLDLQATLTNAASKKVTWSIQEGSGYATVTASGKVTAAKDLTAAHKVVVKAVAADGSGAEDTMEITVRPIAQGVQVYSEAGGQMLFSFRTENWWVRSNTTLNWDLSTQADTIAMNARVFPFYEEDSNKDAIQAVTWKSSAPKIAEFQTDADGNVRLKIHKAGTVTITVIAADGSNQKVTFKLKVVKTVTSLTIVDQTVTGGKSLNLAKLLTMEPKDATNKKLNWKITRGGAYATVSASGVFKAKKVLASKRVEVTVSSQDGGASTTFYVTITP